MAYTDIDDPSAYFQIKLYAGTGASLAITNDGNSDLQGDLIWIKGRSGATEHVLTDSSRGVTKEISSNDNGAEETVAQGLTAFGSDGFTVGTDASYNTSSATYTSWQWKSNGGTTASNTDGDITSTVQANTDAGFSIVTYTGNANGSDQTVGHGLGSTCKLVLLKNLTDAGQSWRVYHESVSAAAGGTLFLNGTSEVDAGDGGGDPARIKSTNDSTITLLAYTSPYNAVNSSGKSYLAYCFAEKQGYSKFGSYIGNGSTNGSYIYLGFKPSWVLYKKSSAAENWHIVDNKRDTLNPNSFAVDANTTNAEANDANLQMDFLSNGFKLRTLHGTANASGSTYIYMAFAEHPFVSSQGVPTTAR